MINTTLSKIRSGNTWEIGARVNVGFLKGLTVLKVEAVKDGKPDIYTLQADNGRMYEFTPHNGLSRVN